jgi:hypothetical protein
VLRVLKLQGEYVKGPSSSIEPPVARRLKAAIFRGDYTVPLFPVLGGPDGSRAAALSGQLPKRLPEFIDLLTSQTTAAASIPNVIARAAVERWFFYTPLRAYEAIRRAASRVSKITDTDLPSQSGVAVIAHPGENGQAIVVAWINQSDRVELVTTTLTVRPTGSRSRLVATETKHDVVRRFNDTFNSEKATGLRLLGGLTAILPERYSGSSPEIQGKSQPEQGTTAAPDEATEARIIYATRSVLGLGSSSTGVSQARDTRWNVRGHYRNQYIPSTKDHRKIWIDEHTAGAADAEVIQRERVYVIAPRVKAQQVTPNRESS